MRQPEDRESNILLPTVKNPTLTNRADQNEIPWNELTHDADPEVCPTIKHQYSGIPTYPNQALYFSWPIGN